MTTDLSLEQIAELDALEQHSRAAAGMSANTLIWSDEHRVWWKPQGHGYTADPAEAGRWTHDDAERLTRHCGPEKQIMLVPLDGGTLPEWLLSCFSKAQADLLTQARLDFIGGAPPVSLLPPILPAQEGRYEIVYAEPGVGPEIFTGPNALECAVRRWEQASNGYRCHLMMKIPDNLVRAAYQQLPMVLPDLPGAREQQP